jgi:hypothetical protein
LTAYYYAVSTSTSVLIWGRQAFDSYLFGNYSHRVVVPKKDKTIIGKPELSSTNIEDVLAHIEANLAEEVLA